MKEINLYNKYRPTCFNNIVGQEVVKTLLLNLFKSNKNVQTFLFYGPHGTGKTSLARIFAKSWNCESLTEDICNKCKNCQLINDEKTLDLIEIDAASNNGVEFMRELVSNLQYLPLNLKKKIYIIDEAHNLSSQSWNSLLKSIEEPPSHVVFIFLTTQINKVIPTILSRCQKFQFNFLEEKELMDLVLKIAKSENKIISLPVVKKMALLSGGSARELFTVIEQLFLHSDVEVTEKTYEEVFSIPGSEKVLKLTNLILNKKQEKSLSFLDDCFQSGLSLFNLFQELLEFFLEIEIYKKTKNKDLLVKVDISKIDFSLFEVVDILKVLNVLSDGMKHFKGSINHKTVSKILLLNVFDCLSEIQAIEVKVKKTKEIKSAPKISETMPEIEEIKEIKEKEIPHVVHVEKNKKIEKDNEEDSEFFTFKTIQIFPNSINDYVEQENSAAIEYKKEILYGIKNANKELSEKNYEKFLEYIKNECKNVVFLDILKKHITKYQIISSDKTAIIVFDDAITTKLFNEKIKIDNLQDELNKALNEQYIWFSLPLYLLPKYVKKSKAMDQKELDKNIVFSSEKKTMFNEMLNILNI